MKEMVELIDNSQLSLVLYSLESSYPLKKAESMKKMLKLMACD